MSFDENGFLGKEAWILAEKIRKEHEALFKLCREINRFAEKTKLEFEIHSENRQEIVSACLFIRVLEGAQAAIILIERGLDTDAQVVIRGILEALVLLKLSATDENFSFEYLNSQDCRRLDLMKKAHESSKNGIWADIRKRATKKYMEDLENEIRKRGFNPKKFWRRFKPKKLFEKAGMSGLYESTYRVISDFAHTNPLALKRYIAFDKKMKKIYQLNHGPCDDSTKQNLIAIAEFTLGALLCFCNLFKADKDKVIKDLHGKLKKIS